MREFLRRLDSDRAREAIPAWLILYGSMIALIAISVLDLVRRR